MLFISPQKAFSFLNFCFFDHVAKQLNEKDKVNLKFYDITARLTNNGNTHIISHLEKQRQSDNEIWSVNRI